MGHFTECAQAMRGRRVHRMAMYPSGVSAASTGTSCGSCGIGVLVVSHGQQIATTCALAALYSSARSYQPPPRPRRMPDGSTAKAGTMIAERVWPAGGTIRFLRTARIRRTVIAANAAQPFQIVEFAPSDGHAGSQSGHQYAALRVKQRLQQRGHRNFATHGNEGGHRGERVNQTFVTGMQGYAPAGLEAFLGCGAFACGDGLMAHGLFHGAQSFGCLRGVGRFGRVHIACCITTCCMERDGGAVGGTIGA